MMRCVFVIMRLNSLRSKVMSRTINFLNWIRMFSFFSLQKRGLLFRLTLFRYAMNHVSNDIYCVKNACLCLWFCNCSWRVGHALLCCQLSCNFSRSYPSYVTSCWEGVFFPEVGGGQCSNIKSLIKILKNNHN